MRFVSLDSWRGIAALSVALFHFNAAWHGYDWTFERFIHLFVDFFFVLSGLVISQAYAERLSDPRDAAAFLIRRFGRIWPLHAAVLLGFAAVEGTKLIAIQGLGLSAQIAPFAQSGAVPASQLPLHLALLHGIGFADRLTWNTPSWSISAEVWIYVLFALLSLALPRSRTIALTLLGLTAAVVLVRVVSAHDLDLTYDNGLARCLYGFTLGHLVYRARAFVPRPGFLAKAGLSEALVLAVVAAYCVTAAGTSAIAAAPLLIAVAVYVFSFDSGPVSRILRARAFQNLGRWSYSIYMIHGLVLFGLGLAVSVLERKAGVPLWQEMPHAGRIVRTLAIDNAWLLDGALIAFLALVIWLSSWSYRLIEAPARSFFNEQAHVLESVRQPGDPLPAVGPGKKSG